MNVYLDVPKENLFAETQSRFVVSVKPENKAQFEELVADAKLVGEVTSQPVLNIQAKDGKIKVDITKAKEVWEDAIPCLMNKKA